MIKSALRKPHVEQAPPEGRALPFVAKPNPKAIGRINREMRQRMYLMGKRIIGDERSPVGIEFYIMGEIGKIFTVKIREFPSCQCGDFLLSRLCKHMVFVSSRVFRLNQDDPVIWQRALVPSELKRLILNPGVTPVKPKSKFKRLRESFSMGYGPNDVLEHSPMYCPVCCEEVNFFEDEVYERDESLLEQLYNRNTEKKVTSTKAKLDMGTPRRKLNKQKNNEAPQPQATAAPPPTTAAPPPPPAAAPSADSPPTPPTAEGAQPAEGATSVEAQKDGEATAPPPAVAGEEAESVAPPPAAASESAAVPVAEGNAKPVEEAEPVEGPRLPVIGKPFEPLLFCPQKCCEFEGCVKVVHRHCWLEWGRFHKVEWTLPTIIQVNNVCLLGSTCH